MTPGWAWVTSVGACLSVFVVFYRITLHFCIHILSFALLIFALVYVSLPKFGF